MKPWKNRRWSIAAVLGIGALVLVLTACPSTQKATVDVADAASKVYVAPGKQDAFYFFASGGFSGQVGVYGIPSGRLLRVIPVFSQDPEKGWGYSEETKPMLNTSGGFVPWDDTHHLQLSQTDGVVDGRWMFVNGNNTPRIARIDLKTFRTVETIEVPNTAGNHASPFITPGTEYTVAATRFSEPYHFEDTDVSISSFKDNFKGAFSFIKVDKTTGRMNVAFQILMPGFNYDLSHSGKGVSDGWFFFTCYNSEQANTMLEVNASQKDKDFIAAVNWKKAEEYLAQGKGRKVKASYMHNVYDESTHSGTSEMMNDVVTLNPAECPGLVYFVPTPKSPHGSDVDPTGEYIVAGGKLSTVIPVFSFSKIQQAITNKKFDGELAGIPVLNYKEALHGEVVKPGLGPLHTEFDANGNAYTSFFVSSEVVKWSLKDCKVIDRAPTYYSVGHLVVPGGDSKKPWGKYLIAMNKITKDRYLPTGPELTQSAQLYDISGEKMKLLLDFPTIGEPHYAQMCPAELLKPNSVKTFKLTENRHPYVTLGEKETRVERKGNEVHVYMTAIRSHFKPDNIEGVKLGDVVFFHVTNLEQDWDVPHGFAVRGAENAELLIMPGETCTLKWIPKKTGVHAMYCTDFCSALHQEMQGYVRVSPAGAKVELSSNGAKSIAQ
jgi:nitrous-oxide reductase